MKESLLNVKEEVFKILPNIIKEYIDDNNLKDIFCTNKKKMEKVYQVEFLQYTNCSKDTVCNNTESIKDSEYIHVGKEPFLVRESELVKYREYGNGFRIIKFVGNIGE